LGSQFRLHKDFKFGERVVANFGADFDNIFNHPIRMPNQDFGDGSFSYLGGFDVTVDPNVDPTLNPVLEDFNLIQILPGCSQLFRRKAR